MSLERWVRLSATHGEALGISNIEILIYHLLSNIEGEKWFVQNQHWGSL